MLTNFSCYFGECLFHVCFALSRFLKVKVLSLILGLLHIHMHIHTYIHEWVCVLRLHMCSVFTWETMLTSEEKHVRDWRCVLASGGVCLCLHAYELRACGSQGVFAAGCVMWLRVCVFMSWQLMEVGRLKVEPVCLLGVKYSSTWAARLSSVAACRANSMHWPNSELELCDTTSTTRRSEQLPDGPRGQFDLCVLFPAVGFILWALLLKVAGAEFQVPSSR